uniref:Uncharacterized protein n=1 Tax=Rhodopseudomonas palustris (strain ATCC BAA-98 / CGA009) TaxID=258594 RepID=Q6N635_RHOPA|nr:hypothetical protein RPA2783 [Rhodopseudomonas palustris CGA009]
MKPYVGTRGSDAVWPPEIWQVLRRHRLNERTRRLRKSAETATLGHRTSNQTQLVVRNRLVKRGCIGRSGADLSQSARGCAWWLRIGSAQGGGQRQLRCFASPTAVTALSELSVVTAAQRAKKRVHLGASPRSSRGNADLALGKPSTPASLLDPIHDSHKVYYGIYRYDSFTRGLCGIQKVKPAKCVRCLRSLDIAR